MPTAADEIVPPGPDGYVFPPTAPAPCAPTAHQLAGWLAVASPLCRQYLSADSPGIAFPPHPDDLDLLDATWRRRLADLRAAGAAPLAAPSAYRRARECRPHAFAYAGEGRPCRSWFCPYCAAWGAAEAYERVRRAGSGGRRLAVRRYQFYAPAGEARAVVEALVGPRPSGATARPGVRVAGGEYFRGWDPADTLVRVRVEPTDGRFPGDSGRVAISARVVSVVPAAAVEQSLAFRRALADWGREWRAAGRAMAAWRASPPEARGEPPPPAPRPPGAFGVDDRFDPLDGQDLIGPSPAAAAGAAARLEAYPAGLITAPPEAAAAVLDLAAGLRQSAVRGVFRSAGAIRPGAARRAYVRAADGDRPAGVLLAAHPEPPPDLAARALARELGLPRSDSFAAVGGHLGCPVYWLGRYEVTILDAFGDRRPRTPFKQLVAAARPKRPGRPHLLAGVCSSGFYVLWTCSGLESRGVRWDLSRVARPYSDDQDFAVTTGLPLRRVRYNVATAALFRYLALEARVTGPLALPPGGPPGTGGRAAGGPDGDADEPAGVQGDGEERE